MTELIHEQIFRLDIPVDDAFFLTVHQCGTDIPAQSAYLQDGGQGTVSASPRQDFLKAGEQFHPHEETAGRTFPLERIIFYSHNIRCSAEGLHDLNLTKKRFRDITLTYCFRFLGFRFSGLSFPVILSPGGRRHCSRPAVDLDDFEGGIHSDPEIVPVNLKDIAGGAAAQTPGNMPVRPHGPEFFLDYLTFYIVTAAHDLLSVLLFLTPLYRKGILGRFLFQRQLFNKTKNC